MSQDAEHLDEDAYELDLDDADEGSVDRVIEDAVAAVERHSTERETSSHAEDESGASRPATDRPGANGTPAASDEDEALRDRLVRTLADFDNYRKRSEREKEALKRFAVADLMKDILDVVDNLERALISEGGVGELKQGVEMILRQQREIMRRHGVRRVEAEGQPFDPTVHEAVARQEQDDLSGPTVIAELQSGYMLHDRLLRPAMVNVAMPSRRPAPAATAEDGEEG